MLVDLILAVIFPLCVHVYVCACVCVCTLYIRKKSTSLIWIVFGLSSSCLQQKVVLLPQQHCSRFVYWLNQLLPINQTLKMLRTYACQVTRTLGTYRMRRMSNSFSVDIRSNISFLHLVSLPSAIRSYATNKSGNAGKSSSTAGSAKKSPNILNTVKNSASTPSSATSKSTAPVASSPSSPSNKYEADDYFQYDLYSYNDLNEQMEKYRLPQPTAKWMSTDPMEWERSDFLSYYMRLCGKPVCTFIQTSKHQKWSSWPTKNCWNDNKTTLNLLLIKIMLTFKFKQLD